MKKLLLSAILLASTMTWGQEKEEKLIIEKGTWGVSGQISTSHDKTTFENTPNLKNTNSIFNLFPSTEYFISDNLSLGLSLGYGYFKGKSSNTNFNSETTINNYSFAPFVTKYIPITKRLAFSLHSELSYTYSDSKSINSNTPTVINTGFAHNYAINIRPGISFFVSKNIALDANIGQLGYNYRNHKGRADSSSESFTSGFNFNLNSSSILLGASLYL
ncbi:autotransporter outer membrane beta-barrel domain-containing protein [Tenacibaculum amylolyticum]|uniref:autotransporter outer membrane beta-barrel domain-containing protein n=1 Tax=Tenacibaculum amylolyticum TaxID=104269 RepID=UPI003895DA61